MCKTIKRVLKGQNKKVLKELQTISKNVKVIANKKCFDVSAKKVHFKNNDPALPDKEVPLSEIDQVNDINDKYEETSSPSEVVSDITS